VSTPIEQEAPALPVHTPQATDHPYEAALLKSLETLMACLGYLERQVLLIAVEIDVKRDHAIAEQQPARSECPWAVLGGQIQAVLDRDSPSPPRVADGAVGGPVRL
jgi:hypothetical protein